MQTFPNYAHSQQDSFILENIDNNSRENTNNAVSHIWINFPLLSSFKSRKWLQLKITQQLMLKNFYLLATLVTLPLGIQNLSLYKRKQTNYYLVVVTSRLGLNSQVMRAQFLYAHALSFFCFYQLQNICSIG
jgi:hypothetical protein